MAEIGLVFEPRKPSMRVVQNEQMTIGEVDVSKMSFDYKSRDDIPKILKGLQFVYTNPALRSAIFELLEAQVLLSAGQPTNLDAIRRAS